MNEKLERLRKEIERCSKCGQCRSVCPVFAESLAEPQVARGKIALAGAALDGDIRASKVLRERMTLCLNCKSCVADCPAEVRADDIILAARADLHEAGKSPFLKQAFIDNVWTRGRVFARAMQTASQLQPLLFKREASGGGRSRVRLPGVDPERRIPLLESESFLSRSPEIIRPEGNPKARVGLFIGCASNWVYPSIANSMVNLLRNAGVEVVIPRDQECCGVPMLNAGAFEKAREQREKNRSAFRRHSVEAVVTACASCGLALKKEMEEMLGDGAYLPGVPIYDLTEFLVNQLGIDLKGSIDSTLVTYHDPCHLNRGQGITDEPRKLIQSISGAELIEMPDAERCCGGGGLFSLSHYDVALRIGARKAEAIGHTGASIVATACPACMIQLTDAVARSGQDVRVVHVAELLAEAVHAT